MGGVDGVAGFNAKVDMDERIGSVGWVLSKGITPTRSGNAGQGQEAVWNILGTRMSAPDCFATITMASLAHLYGPVWTGRALQAEND